MNTPAPHVFPEKGFYYHYKHDPLGTVNNYAYEFLYVGHHTEDNCRPEDQYLAVYQPLYPEALVYRKGKMVDVRPLSMFMEGVNVHGTIIPRFEKITDSNIIAELKKIRDEMYVQ